MLPSSRPTRLLLVSPVPRLQMTGICPQDQSSPEFISSSDDCKAASRWLGLYHQFKVLANDTEPYGCMYRTSDVQAVFNEKGFKSRSSLDPQVQQICVGLFVPAVDLVSSQDCPQSPVGADAKA